VCAVGIGEERGEFACSHVSAFRNIAHLADDCIEVICLREFLVDFRFQFLCGVVVVFSRVM
jgi:hypothetical protein